MKHLKIPQNKTYTIINCLKHKYEEELIDITDDIKVNLDITIQEWDLHFKEPQYNNYDYPNPDEITISKRFEKQFMEAWNDLLMEQYYIDQANNNYYDDLNYDDLYENLYRDY